LNVSFEQLKSMVVYAQIVERGSLSGAAKHLNLSRAVVSYHLKKLETHLGLKLLNRTTRSFTLTDAGDKYYQHCQEIALQAESANQQIENLKNEPEGLLKITCPVNVGLQIIVPALNEFKRLYPKIELDLMLTDEIVNIMQEGIDLAIRGAPLKDSGLQARKLVSLQTCLCAAPDYLNQHGRPSAPTELVGHNWVIYKLSSNTVTLSKGSRSYSVKVQGSISTNNAAARTAFVEGGHGLACIPQYDAAPKIAAQTLELILTDYQLPDKDLYCVFPPGNGESKKHRVLLDYLKEHFNRGERAGIY
jgi:DNA-binding transcriptional LysR family regulator